MRHVLAATMLTLIVLQYAGLALAEPAYFTIHIPEGKQILPPIHYFNADYINISGSSPKSSMAILEGPLIIDRSKNITIQNLTITYEESPQPLIITHSTNATIRNVKIWIPELMIEGMQKPFYPIIIDSSTNLRIESLSISTPTTCRCTNTIALYIINSTNITINNISIKIYREGLKKGLEMNADLTSIIVLFSKNLTIENTSMKGNNTSVNICSSYDVEISRLSAQRLYIALSTVKKLKYIESNETIINLSTSPTNPTIKLENSLIESLKAINVELKLEYSKINIVNSTTSVLIINNTIVKRHLYMKGSPYLLAENSTLATVTLRSVRLAYILNSTISVNSTTFETVEDYKELGYYSLLSDQSYIIICCSSLKLSTPIINLNKDQLIVVKKSSIYIAGSNLETYLTRLFLLEEGGKLYLLGSHITSFSYIAYLENSADPYEIVIAGTMFNNNMSSGKGVYGLPLFQLEHVITLNLTVAFSEFLMSKPPVNSNSYYYYKFISSDFFNGVKEAKVRIYGSNFVNMIPYVPNITNVYAVFYDNSTEYYDFGFLNRLSGIGNYYENLVRGPVANYTDSNGDEILDNAPIQLGTAIDYYPLSRPTNTITPLVPLLYLPNPTAMRPFILPVFLLGGELMEAKAFSHLTFYNLEPISQVESSRQWSLLLIRIPLGVYGSTLLQINASSQYSGSIASRTLTITIEDKPPNIQPTFTEPRENILVSNISIPIIIRADLHTPSIVIVGFFLVNETNCGIQPVSLSESLLSPEKNTSMIYLQIPSSKIPPIQRSLTGVVHAYSLMYINTSYFLLNLKSETSYNITITPQHPTNSTSTLPVGATTYPATTTYINETSRGKSITKSQLPIPEEKLRYVRILFTILILIFIFIIIAYIKLLKKKE